MIVHLKKALTDTAKVALAMALVIALFAIGVSNIDLDFLLINGAKVLAIVAVMSFFSSLCELDQLSKRK